MKKTITIDLSNLENPNCGVGQIALNYARYFGAMDPGDIKFVFYVPKQAACLHYGNAGCVRAGKIYRHFPFLLPETDVWHSINQQCSKLVTPPRRARHILTVHDLNFIYEEHPPSKKKRYMARLHRQINRADIITVISKFTESEIRRHFNPGGREIKVIYNGVEKIFDRKEQQPVFIKDVRRPFFFTIGQVLRKKNFHVLLDVMKAFPGHDLYISGEDRNEYAMEIRGRIKTGGLANVFLTGAIGQAGKIWLYRHCEAFFFPSLLEGFGLPVIEAMQFGKPVFSSNRTSLPEICGGHAFLWENFDADYMIQSIQNFIIEFHSDPGRTEKERAYAATFGYDKHIAEYLKLYRMSEGMPKGTG